MRRDSDSQKLDWGAVIKGLAVSIAIGVGMGVALGLAGLGLAFGTSVDVSGLADSAPFHAFAVVVSLVPGLIGAYVAARDADHSQIRHAIATGLALLTLDVLCRFAFLDLPRSCSDFVYLLLIVPNAALGGWIATKVG